MNDLVKIVSTGNPEFRSISDRLKKSVELGEVKAVAIVALTNHDTVFTDFERGENVTICELLGALRILEIDISDALLERSFQLNTD